jgi:hypothetical protein
MSSIVEMPFGVYYASRNGLQLVSTSGVQNATQQLITPDEWEAEYDLSTLTAARYNDYYVGFYTSTDGFMFAPSEPTAIFTQLRNHWNVDGLQTDPNTGKTIVIKDNIVSEWNHPGGEPKLYTWKSKRFVLPTPSNMSAYRVYTYDVSKGIEDNDARTEYNNERITFPLNPLGFTALGTSKGGYVANGSQYDNKAPLGYEILVQAVNTYSLAFNLYADGELVHTDIIDTTEPLRLPTGYKATRLEIELVGNKPVTSFKISSTAKGLRMI